MSTAARPARYVGASVARVEDPSFLTGKARYLDDVSLPGMLHASFVRSTHAHARIVSIDVDAARQLDGVVAVLTGHDLKDVLGPLTTSMPRDEVKTATRFPLALEKVRCVGDPVAVVIATSRYLAEDGCDLVDVEWEPLPAVLDPELALSEDSPLLDEELGDNNIGHIEGGAGDVDAAFATAHRVFSKRFVHGRTTAASMETRGVIAEWDESTSRMTIYSSTQMPYLARTILGPTLTVPEGKLTVIAPAVGGGFGLKCHVFPEDAVIPAAARLLGRPVKWVEDRAENLATGVHTKGLVADVEIAVDEHNNFTAFRGHFIGDGGAYSATPFTPLIDPLCCGTLLPSIYAVENIAYTVDAPLTNKCQIGAVRGVGWSPGHTVREVLIDDIAYELGVDPIELRLQNCIPSEPYESALGAKYDGGSYAESLELARDSIGYEEFRRRQEAARKEGRYLGIGFSPFVEPTGLGSDGAAAAGFPYSYYDSTCVTLETDGSVTVKTGLHSHGQGHETSFAQLAADELGVRLENVRVMFSDTDASVFGMGTYASRSAVIASGTISLAAGDVRNKIRMLAGQLLEVSPEDVTLYDGQASVAGSPQRTMSISDVALFAYFGGKARPAELEEPAITSTRTYDPPETYSNGAVAAIVEVDAETGFIKVEKVVAVEDCGVMLNPMIVDGQVAGAIAQGIGLALLEDASYDDDGQFLSGSFADYFLPTATDVPTIQIEHIETPSTASLAGVKGMGEGGTIAAPAAVINAVADALQPFGVRIDRTPVTPSYVLDLLRGARPLAASSS